MVGCVLVLLDKFPHEIPQQLRAGTVALLGCHGELLLQRIVDSEGEGRFADPVDLLCYTGRAL
jgi:hypothetical protein